MRVASELLSREEFDRQVRLRSKGRCVFCNNVAADAHHILDRKLFSDGGYYLDNGAAVCHEHHWKCETTEISVEQVREAAGITNVVLPPGYPKEMRYDKWGNIIVDENRRLPGALAEDVGCRKALTMGHVIWQLY